MTILIVFAIATVIFQILLFYISKKRNLSLNEKNLVISMHSIIILMQIFLFILITLKAFNLL